MNLALVEILLSIQIILSVLNSVSRQEDCQQDVAAKEDDEEEGQNVVSPVNGWLRSIGLLKGLELAITTGHTSWYNQEAEKSTAR